MFHLIRMHKNPPKRKFEENICSYRFRFKIQVSCILLLNPEVQNILSLLHFCIVLLWCCVLIVRAWLYQRLLWNVTIICMSEETRRTQRSTPLGGAGGRLGMCERCRVLTRRTLPPPCKIPPGQEKYISQNFRDKYFPFVCLSWAFHINACSI